MAAVIVMLTRRRLQAQVATARLQSNDVLELKKQQHGGHGLAWKAGSFHQRIEAGRLKPKGI
jgi:hypothetical protein